MKNLHSYTIHTQTTDRRRTDRKVTYRARLPALKNFFPICSKYFDCKSELLGIFSYKNSDASPKNSHFFFYFCTGMIPRRPDMTPWLSFAYKLKKMFFTTPYFSPSLSTILATNQTPTCPGDVCVHRTPLETPVNFLYCFCHTRFHLGFSSKLRIWKVSSCKVEPRSGIIFGHNPT